MIIENIFKTSKIHSCSIIYPIDVMVGKNFENISQVKELHEVANDDLILDIGLKTIKKINRIIEISRTVLWNGPAGYFENKNLTKGSYEIAKKITEQNKNNFIYSVVGGGNTIAVLNQIDILNEFNFVSTAGGAFFEFLDEKKLPSIEVLK